MFSGFYFNRIVIIQSLESHEVETGALLSEYIIGLDNTQSVEVINCSSANDFLEVIKKLVTCAYSGSIALLHVECHGDIENGLEFQNSSVLGWEQVASSLRALNIASKFNLLAVFSACFGAYFLGQMGSIKPAPCWCLLAPTKQINPAEVLRGFRVFYRALYNDSDLATAMNAIHACDLDEGEWFCQSAETWYEMVTSDYVKNHCEKAVARERAKILHRRLKLAGIHKGVGSILREIQKSNRKNFLSKHFEIYFMTSEIPENIQRFKNTRQRINKEIEELRNTGRYVI